MIVIFLASQNMSWWSDPEQGTFYYSQTCAKDHLRTKIIIAKPVCKDHQIYLQSDHCQRSVNRDNL